MVSIGHHHDLDNPNFSVIPDLIRHPENQLPESNWTPAPGSSPDKLRRNDNTKKSIIIDLSYL
jgi:hypothetical protein